MSRGTTRDFSMDSGERIVAFTRDDAPLDHVARYDFAASYLKGKTPRLGIDCFSGSGYGTAILGERLSATILGIDGSLQSVYEASQRLTTANVMFAHNVFPFLLPREALDFVVSMESIEHVEDDLAFATAMTASLVEGGTLIVSAPNRNRVDLSINPYHWHFRHYTPEEMILLFTRCGMTFRFLLSSNCVMLKDKKAVAVNYFGPQFNVLRKDDPSGDTCTYVFEKESR